LGQECFRGLENCRGGVIGRIYGFCHDAHIAGEFVGAFGRLLHFLSDRLG